MTPGSLLSNLRQVGIAVLSASLATLLTFPLAPKMVHSRDLVFIAAVILVSRYAGVLAGILVALFSVLAFDWYFDQTPHVMDFTLGNGLRIVVFVAVALLITLLDRQRRSALREVLTMNVQLQKALDEIKTLRGILPICSYCKKIMSAPETWVEVENYIRRHSEAEFSHGICPDCTQKHFPEIAKHRTP